MKLKQARLLAYIIQFFLGLHTGLYINVYIAIFGQTGSFFIDLDPKLIGLTWIGLLFLIEYPLELFGGAAADQLGSKSTFASSFMLKGFFSIGTAVFMIYFPPTDLGLYLLISIILLVSFAAAFTLLSGNFEIWLHSLCIDQEQSDAAFTYSETFFWISLTFGGIVSLLLSEEISLIISGICAFIASAICLLIIEESQSEQSTNNKLKITEKDHLKNKDFWKLVKEAKPLLQQELPDVNRVFWVLAIVYGLAQTMEGLIPTYYVLSKGPKAESLIIVIGCLWLPSLIGAAYKTPFVRNSLFYLSSKIHFIAPFLIRPIPTTNSINNLRNMTLKYAFVSALIPITLFIPSTVLRLIALGLSIFFARTLYGALRPLFKSYAASRIHEASTTLPHNVRQRLGKKTIMSIGEQRMKLGAIISILPFYLVEGLWKINKAPSTQVSVGDAWPYFAALGLTAIALIFIANILLRNHAEEPPHT